MDRLSRAEAALAAAASRSADVLLPGRVTSPMDCHVTAPISREVVDGCQQRAERETAAAAGLPPPAGPVLDDEMIRLSAGPDEPAARRHSA